MTRIDVDFGSDVRGFWLYNKDVLGPIGMMIVHKSPKTGDDCWCSLHWSDKRGGECHKLESLNPLTVSPSLLCPECGLHGYIRNGAWVS